MAYYWLRHVCQDRSGRTNTKHWQLSGGGCYVNKVVYFAEQNHFRPELFDYVKQLILLSEFLH